MATTLEELTLRISADTRQLRSELRKGQVEVQRSANRMAKAFEPLRRLTRGLGKAVLPLAGIAGAAAVLNRLTDAIRTTSKELDRLDKVSERLGVTTEFLQTRFFALNQSGIDTRTSELALQRFTRRAGEAAEGVGEARGAFAALNINLKDSEGNVRDIEDVFDEAVRKLAAVEDETTRLALAFKFFDSEGAKLVQVAGDYDALVQAAREAGVAVGDDVIDAAVEARDKLNQMATTMRTRLSPAFVGVLELAFNTANRLIDIANAIDKVTFRTGIFAKTAVEKAANDLNVLAGSINSLQSQVLQYEQFSSEKALRNNREYNRLVAERNEALEDYREILSKFSPQELREPDPIDANEFDFSRLDRGKEGKDKAAARAAESERKRIAADQIRLMEEIAELSRQKSEEVREQWLDDQMEIRDSFAETTQTLADGFSRAFADMVVSGEASFKEMGKAFVREFVQRAVSALIQTQLLTLLGKLIPSGELAATTATGEAALTAIRGEDLFSGFSARQSGGPVSVGRLYRVNDGAGTELFQPSVQGHIVPAGRANGGGGGVTLNVYNTISDEAEVRSRENPDTRALEIEIVRANARDVNRRGELATTLEKVYGLRRRGVRGN